MDKPTTTEFPSANASRDALPALIAAAREADTLRAQLREVTEERDAAQYLAERRGADLDVLRAQLREVTAHRDVLREAAIPFFDAVRWDAAERAVCMAVNATGADDIAASVREHNTPERIAELLVQNERLQARLDRALRACHIVTYGDGGVTECADVVGELENSKRLDELKEESR